MQDALRQLTASELLFARGAPPKATYVFKHALVQDTAYHSLVRSRRQRIHADIAVALAEHLADQVKAPAATIARHYTEAGLAEPAVRYWLAAAELALSHSALAEANRHVDAGLVLIPHLTEGEGRQSLELGLQLARANAFLQLKGYGAHDTVEALRLAKRHIDAGIGSDLQRFSVLYGLCSANLAAARHKPALTLARQIVEVANHQGDTTYKIVGYRLVGTLQCYMGENREALKSLQAAERYRDPAQQRQLSYRFAGDPGLAVLCYKCWALLFLGLYNASARVAEQIQVELQSHRHAPTIALCNYLAVVWPSFVVRDFAAFEHRSAEFVAYCIEKKLEYLRLHADVCLAQARAEREPTKANVAALRSTIDAKRRSGTRVAESFAMSHLAEVLLRAGDLKRAQAALQRSFTLVEQFGERFWLAEMHRLSGHMALKAPKQARARRNELQNGHRHRPTAGSAHIRTASGD
jgi:hypothetical protein